MEFKDHFSAQAQAYSRFRPGYPPELFRYLAHTAPSRQRAWDVATGNGQAAQALAEYFQEVVATDASAAQIQNAKEHAAIKYRVEAAEKTSLDSNSIDLVTVAQALHWLDLERFYPEVKRVLRPQGIFAAWAYPLHHISPEIDPILWDFYENTVGPYWPPERHHIEKKYESLVFPFPLIETPAFTFTLEWNLAELLGYLKTWSAYQHYLKDRHLDPLDAMTPTLNKVWGPKEKKYMIRWDLTLKLCRKPSL